MLFNSFQFLLFFPIVTFFYFVLPQRFRWILLLGASCYFYMKFIPKYILIVVVMIIKDFFSGILIERIKSKKRKIILVINIILSCLVLFLFKYYNFFNESIMEIARLLKLNYTFPTLNIILPIGLSFLLFQSLGYVIDVYRGQQKAEKNFGIYSLFVLFYPQLVAGPIERAQHLLHQLREDYYFDYQRVKEGLLLMLWGFIKKVVIADRLAILVSTVYNNPTEYRGFPLIIATLFFSFQIYCDFSSYSDIARGAAKVMGFDLMKNFHLPYFSKSIAEFWRNWHISLSTWFKDYIYIPLGGSRTTKIKFYRNILIIFAISGLWHGASWNFIIWGLLHAFYQIIGIEIKPIRSYLKKIFKINEDTIGHKLYKTILTFLLVSFAWIFFRANSFYDAIYIIKNLFNFDPWSIFDGSIYKLGLDRLDFNLSLILLVIAFGISMLQKKFSMIEKLQKEHLILRWSIYLIGLFSIIIFGIYGNKYDASQFIYFQF